MAALKTRISRMRRPRRRDPLKLRSRLRRFIVWASGQSADLDGTGTPQTFTPTASTNILTINSHGWQSGDGPFVVASTGALPSGLSADQIYWVSRVNANVVRLHLTFVEASRGLNPVNFSNAGSGTRTLVPATTDQAIVEYLRRSITPMRITLETDVDNFF